MNGYFKSLLAGVSLLLVLIGMQAPTGYAFDLPSDFENAQVLANLTDPDGFAFSPDGRMFISERITGRLLVAKQNGDQWVVNADPFYTFDIPKNGANVPEARRSAGLRDITFDPDFASNGYIYAFYMLDDVHHNRVVRLKADGSNPDTADATFGEQLLIKLPFNSTQSSGSHNGGALEFGNDGKLYITTGDGWTGTFAGDSVQSLTTFTGKVLRINPDGSIPAGNPFYGETAGAYRAIYALGLRNPYSMSRHPETGLLYINEARGTKKADIYIVEAGANYGHQGNSLGNVRSRWGNASEAGGELITGGAWYPQSGPFPQQYHGAYFTALWGGNGDAVGRIATIKSNSDPTVSTFETNVGLVGANSLSVKPVITRIGPDGNLYYMLTTYTTNSGTIQMVRYTGQETVMTPLIDPTGATSLNPVSVTISSPTAGAQIYYTLDSGQPTTGSTLYSGPITISSSAILKAKAFKDGLNPSGTASALFTIGQEPVNQPPQVDAGADLITAVGQSVSLDGSATTDPDGDDNFLTDEQWSQLSGPAVSISDSTEEVAFFTPAQAGTYRFRLSMSDTKDFGSDEVTVTVFEKARAGQPVVLYTFYEGAGETVHDVAGNGDPLDLTIQTPSTVDWMANGALVLNGSSTISSQAAAGKISDACKSSGEITIEAWIRSADLDQTGPARIVSISASPFLRNVTLGQVGDEYDGRIRTTGTNDNGEPSIRTAQSGVTTDLAQVVFTHNSTGNSAIIVDGETKVTSTSSGDLSGWNDGYSLFLGNEQTGDRPWLGSYEMVAIYCESLSAADIDINRQAGLPFSVIQVGAYQIYLPLITN